MSLDHDDSGQHSVSNKENEARIFDYRPTPLDACSIETCSGHCLQWQSSESETSDDENSIVTHLPLCLGCYQLDKTTGTRQGQLDLYAIPVVKNTNREQSSRRYSIQSFGDDKDTPPLTICGGTTSKVSGILDGKWCPTPYQRQSELSFENYYATAHASGEIMIHNIFANGAIISDINAKTRNPFQAKFAGKTTQEELSVADPNSPCLCLAIAWDQSCNNGNDAIPLNTRIISSYSDGNAAIHQIQQSSSGNVELSTSLEHCWPAHKMFNSPSEVWCCAFLSINNNDNTTYPTNIVATGGDEGCWKMWDLRTNLSRPIYHNTNAFDAGVTVLSPHPRQSNLLVVGSYDETIALYDVRYVSSSSSPTSLFHSDAIGGGIWRCKWHPKDDNRLLIAAMHGGCRIVQFADHLVAPQGRKCDHDAGSEIPIQFHSVFTEHKSMAYGCDWLVYPNDAIVEGKKDEVVEAAVSCSFYDQTMYLWSAPITDSI